MPVTSNKRIERILKNCFWEYAFTPEDILHMADGDDWEEKRFLFEKILANSTQMLDAMKIFRPEDLEKLLDSYVVPRFNHDYLARRKNIVEFCFFDKPLTVRELQWIV